MSSETCVEIQEGAIFIADSHYPHHGDAFFEMLAKLDRGEIETSQLFLMGDNFDLLFGHNDYIQQFSHDAIVLLQIISKKIEIHYFEGNHDFCLENIFPDIQVYSREQQPVEFRLNNQRVAMSHGDKYVTGFCYNLYTKLLRNKITLTLLRPIQKLLINYSMRKLPQKNICTPFTHFEKRVSAILEHYKAFDLVIEGHFHQSKIIGKYISLPSQACQNKVAVVKEGEMVFKKL